MIALLMSVAAGSAAAQVQDQGEYYCSNPRAASNDKYKNVAENWWPAFVLKEFDKVAAAPGVDWTQEMKTPGVVDEWIDKAAAKGWVVKRGPKDAAVGAILIVSDFQNHMARLAIIKEVYAWGAVAESVEPERGDTGHVFEQEYKWLDLYRNPKQSFIGYIWPVKQADYDKAPQEFEAKRFTPKGEHVYKGWRESWGPVWVIKEFDKLAPNGGMDWSGKVDAWLTNAAKKGWKVSYDASGAKPGAILLRIENKNEMWLQIVREVKSDRVVLEMLGYPVHRVVREEIKFSDLPQKNFTGYILPEK